MKVSVILILSLTLAFCTCDPMEPLDKEGLNGPADQLLSRIARAAKPVTICSLPPETKCVARSKRMYTYDPKTNKCKTHDFKGCGVERTANLFDSEYKCRQSCVQATSG